MAPKLLLLLMLLLPNQSCDAGSPLDMIYNAMFQSSSGLADIYQNLDNIVETERMIHPLLRAIKDIPMEGLSYADKIVLRQAKLDLTGECGGPDPTKD